MKRDFISILDWTSAELEDNLQLALELKQASKRGHFHIRLDNHSYALIFHKNSLRTRVSFEVAIHQLGAHPIHLNELDFTMKRESIRDIAKVMSRYVDGILIRTFSHEDVVALGQHAEVPVINMLTDWNHPCQIMADALTLLEHFGTLHDLKIVYLGDGNNVTHSWINLAARLPIDLWIATSPETLPNLDLVHQAQAAGGRVTFCHSPQEAVREADVLYTDVWASMGQKDKTEIKAAQLRDFQINQTLLSLAKPSAVVMHCLPAERGREITDEVLDGSQSIVIDQAENRLHAQKAILVQLERWRSGHTQAL